MKHFAIATLICLACSLTTLAQDRPERRPNSERSDCRCAHLRKAAERIKNTDLSPEKKREMLRRLKAKASHCKNKHDRGEDKRDRKEDRRDRKEDLRDRRHDGGNRDKFENRRDRKEDRRGKEENRRDRAQRKGRRG